jgi:uncharacterized protein (DUF58 family)
MAAQKLRRSIVRENRIYILPTGRGLLLLAFIVVLILTAATYNNNLIFVLAFMLFSAFVVSMLQTHYNLKGVRLKYIGSEEAFQGDPLSLLFHIQQKRARFKFALRMRSLSKRFKTLSNTKEDLKPTENFKAARLDILAWMRGIYPVPEVALETNYPLGLFRAWKVFRPQGHLVIYPQPLAKSPLTSTLSEQGEHDLGLRTTPDGDFGELKAYLPGESYHQIAWKQYARTRDLYSKVHWGSEHKHYILSWNPPAHGFEDYLRQMSGWIKQAADENASFELSTGNVQIEPGRGFEHARKCWRALAGAKSA